MEHKFIFYKTLKQRKRKDFKLLELKVMQKSVKTQFL